MAEENSLDRWINETGNSEFAIIKDKLREERLTRNQREQLHKRLKRHNEAEIPSIFNRSPSRSPPESPVNVHHLSFHEVENENDELKRRIMQLSRQLAERDEKIAKLEAVLNCRTGVSISTQTEEVKEISPQSPQPLTLSDPPVLTFSVPIPYPPFSPTSSSPIPLTSSPLKILSPQPSSSKTLAPLSPIFPLSPSPKVATLKTDKYICKYHPCPYTTNAKSNYTRHINYKKGKWIHHPASNNAPLTKQKYLNANGLYVCPVCDKTDKFAGNMNRHILKDH
jgi:hypothetical protein